MYSFDMAKSFCRKVTSSVDVLCNKSIICIFRNQMEVASFRPSECLPNRSKHSVGRENTPSNRVKHSVGRQNTISDCIKYCAGRQNAFSNRCMSNLSQDWSCSFRNLHRVGRWSTLSDYGKYCVGRESTPPIVASILSAVRVLHPIVASILSAVRVLHPIVASILSAVRVSIQL